MSFKNFWSGEAFVCDVVYRGVKKSIYEMVTGVEPKITGIERTERGKIYHLIVKDENLKILITSHAEKRSNRWKLDIKKVIDTLIDPEEVVTGHHNRYIAHRRYGKHLVRAVYEYEEGLPVVVTVYFPSVKRYFKGGGTYADRIFS